MPYRTTPFINGNYFHVFNRGVEKRKIFLDSWDYKRLLKTIVFYNDSKKKGRLSWQASTSLVRNKSVPIVSFSSYCLMPNHFHFLMRQDTEAGISTFMRKISNSYTKYFNTKYKRVGPLFQGQFKAVAIKSDEQLLHTLRYIHLNPFVGKNNGEIKSFIYPYSSYSEYLEKPMLCKTDLVISLFNSIEKFDEFHKDHLDYARNLEAIKHFEED